MKAFPMALTAAAGLLLSQANDVSAQFPSLQTTVRDPLADAGAPLTSCALLGGRRLCAEPLADSWCRQQGFARFISWSTIGEVGAACRNDADQCALVVTITCARVPIVSG